jgi:hypothetical protein
MIVCFAVNKLFKYIKNKFTIYINNLIDQKLKATSKNNNVPELTEEQKQRQEFIKEGWQNIFSYSVSKALERKKTE